jgi:hypothetical protein
MPPTIRTYEKSAKIYVKYLLTGPLKVVLSHLRIKEKL